jgi:hypothetical protein
MNETDIRLTEVHRVIEATVIELAGEHYKSILKTFSQYSSEFSQSDEMNAKILVYSIFLECFMIRNELFSLGQNGQQANRVVESILFRSLDRAFVDGGMTELTLRGMGVINHLAGAKDFVGKDVLDDCVVRRFVIAIDETLGLKKSYLTDSMLCISAGAHVLSALKAHVYREIAKLAKAACGG